MNYKIEGGLRRNRTRIMIGLILWLILVIVFVAPFSFSAFEASLGGKFDLNIFFDQVLQNITNPFKALGGIISSGAMHNYFSWILGFTIIYACAFFIGFARTAPKNEFTDIEHGSSDWSQRGEQYQILSKNKGIILAENNYLPLDKRGNVNVLVVGRFRFW